MLELFERFIVSSFDYFSVRISFDVNLLSNNLFIFIISPILNIFPLNEVHNNLLSIQFHNLNIHSE